MRPIIITGTQRSGTSLVAGCLFYAGVYMGEYFLKRDKHNPTGYFEDTEFGLLDEQRSKEEIKEDVWRTGVKDIIKRRNEFEIMGFSRWGWKNPSSGLFITDYKKLCNPYIIWCKRNEEDTLTSMEKMHWKGDGAKRTHDTKIDSMNQLSKDEYLEVYFEDVLENPGLEIGRILGYVDMKVSKVKLKKVFNHIIQPPNLKIMDTESYQNYL